MGSVRKFWWFIPAGFVALALIAFGIGNLVEDDGGPLYGRIVAAVIFAAAGFAILLGMLLRLRGSKTGSWLILAGVIPGLASFALLWFPPAWVIGFMSVTVIVAAARDYSQAAPAHAEAA